VPALNERHSARDTRDSAALSFTRVYFYPAVAAAKKEEELASGTW